MHLQACDEGSFRLYKSTTQPLKLQTGRHSLSAQLEGGGENLKMTTF